MSRKSLLLVDDDPIFVDAIAAVLETRYDIRTASNGPTAMAAIDAGVPDLVVLDVMMDYPSEGFDVARQLQNDDRTRRVPIVMLTGVDQLYNYRMETDETWVPCARYLEKPITPDRLLGVVDDLLA